ncbi:MAG: SemiSWEET family transporter [bacterium]
MPFSDTLGLFAGFLTSAGFLPQIVKSYQTKKIADVALWQPILLIISMSLWFTYGLLTGQMPVIVTNAFAIACNAVILVMKFIYREKK